MKKIITIIAIFIMMIPFIVKADMGAPEIRPYQVIVTNPDGIDYYNWNRKKDGHLDKDTVLNITMEYEFDDGLYLSFERGFVKAKDVMLKKEKVTPEDEGVIKVQKRTILIGEETKLLNGPSQVYGDAGTIPEGQIVEYEYTLEPQYEQPSPYIYVTYEKESGWISSVDTIFYYNSEDKIEDERPGFGELGDQLQIIEDIKLDCTTLKKGTILTKYWYTDVYHQYKILYEDDTCKGTFDTFKKSIALPLGKDGYRATTTKELELYDMPEGKAIKTIAAQTELVEYSIYSLIDGNEYEYYYVDVDGTKGWLKEDTNSGEKVLKISKVIVKATDAEPESEEKKEEPAEPQPEQKEKKKKETEEEPEKKTDSKTVLIGCIIGGVALVLAAIVTIVLINKKKKTTNVS